MAKECNCQGRPCYECSTAGETQQQIEDDSFAAWLGYD